jgi:hypothetical protein
MPFFAFHVLKFQGDVQFWSDKGVPSVNYRAEKGLMNFIDFGITFG